MGTIIYIYTLTDPKNNEVRYVGKTINPERRYKQHLYDKRRSHKASWVQSLRNDNLKPIMSIIEECTESNWRDSERYWIQQFNNLTNLKEGGGADYRRTTSDETKKILSEKYKGRKLDKNWKLKIGLSMPTRKEIIINDIKYSSISEARRKLKVGYNTLMELM